MSNPPKLNQNVVSVSMAALPFHTVIHFSLCDVWPPTKNRVVLPWWQKPVVLSAGAFWGPVTSLWGYWELGHLSVSKLQCHLAGDSIPDDANPRVQLWTDLHVYCFLYNIYDFLESSCLLLFICAWRSFRVLCAAWSPLCAKIYSMAWHITAI